MYLPIISETKNYFCCTKYNEIFDRFVSNVWRRIDKGRKNASRPHTVGKLQGIFEREDEVEKLSKFIAPIEHLHSAPYVNCKNEYDLHCKMKLWNLWN